MSQSKHPNIDYASQNEEWLLLGERLEEEAMSVVVNTNTNTNPDENTAAHLQSSMVVAARIGRLANIQCAMVDGAVEMSVGNGNGNNTAASQYALQHLLLQTQHEFDLSQSQPLVDLLVQSVKTKKKSSAKKKKNKKSSNTTQQQQPSATSLDMDAFFQEYPECMRPDWGLGWEDDSDSDDTSTLQSSQSSTSRSRKKKKSPPSSKAQRVETTSTSNTTPPTTTTKNAATSQQSSTAAVAKKKPSPSKDQENRVPAFAAAGAAALQQNPYQNTNLNSKATENAMEVEDLTQQSQSQQSQSSQQTQSQQPPVNTTFQYTPASPNSAASSMENQGMDANGHSQQIGHGQQPQQQMPPPPQQQQLLQQQQQPNAMLPPPNQVVRNTNVPPVTNPYINQQQQRPPVATNYPQQQNAGMNSQPPPPPHQHQHQPPQNNNQNHHHHTQAWQHHVQEQNPFQTAREMAHISGNGNRKEQDDNEQWNQGGDNNRGGGGSDEQWNQQGRQQQPQQARNNNYRQWGQPQQNNGSNNPYGYSYQAAEEPPPQSSTGPIQGGPHIPDSLRQKFRPPGKINGNGGSSDNNGNQQGRTTMSRNTSNHKNGGGGGGGKINRPSSAGGGQRNTSGGGGATVSKRPSSDNDEEELPEELQHLDKELVLKIQNEIMESGETVTFDDIAGLHDAKQTVKEVVVWPMQRPDVFTGLRRAPNGLLLFGPPGTGKTLIGKAIANETKATFFSISSSSLTSKWIGEGEKLVKTLFAVAAYKEPAVVFIDEIDSLLTQRKATENEASRRIKTEFLVQLDGAGTSKQGRVLVIGATNRPQELDEAARRRFTKRMYIPLPTESDRQILLNVMLKNNKHGLSESQIEKLAKDTQGFSGADLRALCTDAAMGPIRELGADAMTVNVEEIPPISFKHFKKSLRATRPSVAPDDITQYIEWDRVYGSTRAEQEDDDDDDDEDEEED